MKHTTMEIQHIPVLLEEVIQSVPNHSKVVIDGTLGYGGHSAKILEAYPNIETYYGFDIDPNIFQKTIKKFENNAKFQGINTSYTKIPEFLKNKQKKADFILLDLGVNMEHFKNKERGFSIQGNEILDMRFNNKGELPTASEILNTASEYELSTIFQKYADFSENKATEIARNIIKKRIKTPITHTQTLKDILQESGLGYKTSIVIFQAIRIATNHEMKNIEQALTTLPHYLNPQGVLAIITFHSIEDRTVKLAFKQRTQKEGYELIQKKAIKPHYTEVQKNRASRSALLRLLRKI